MLTFFWKKMRRNQKGFTLIELIVVIAILGVLAAIAVPNVMGTLSRAKEDADKATAATIANAALEYLVREHPDDVKDIDGAVEPGNKLVKDNYLKETPIPQNKTNPHFYIEITDYSNTSSTNPTIKVFYADSSGNKVDTPQLYPAQ